jgi:hypothetical protein
MDSTAFETTPRLEARHLDRDWGCETCIVNVPLRMGIRLAGLIEATAISGDELQFIWSIENGRVRQHQTIAIGRFKSADGMSYVCLRCPDCRKWRKQLFLVQTADELAVRFSFVCQWCTGPEQILAKRGSLRRRRGQRRPSERSASTKNRRKMQVFRPDRPGGGRNR